MPQGHVGALRCRGRGPRRARDGARFCARPRWETLHGRLTILALRIFLPLFGLAARIPREGRVDLAHGMRAPAEPAV